jgi:TorA maturation chaperone TorD
MHQAREIQRVFFQEHIAQWVPGFCDKVVELAELDFYRDFARMTKALVEIDSQELASGEES